MKFVMGSADYKQLDHETYLIKDYQVELYKVGLSKSNLDMLQIVSEQQTGLKCIVQFEGID